MRATHPFALHHLWFVVLFALIMVVAIFSFARNFAGRTFEMLRRCSAALDDFDKEVIDGLGVNGAGILARAISRISIWCETWIVESPVKLGAGAIRALSIPVRMIQSGLLQSYILLVVIGLIGVLGYYLYTAHHVIR
jgi:hypothetical protein